MTKRKTRNMPKARERGIYVVVIGERKGPAYSCNCWYKLFTTSET